MESIKQKMRLNNISKNSLKYVSYKDREKVMADRLS